MDIIQSLNHLFVVVVVGNFKRLASWNDQEGRGENEEASHTIDQPFSCSFSNTQMSARLEKFDKIWNPSPDQLLPKYYSAEFRQIFGCTEEAVKHRVSKPVNKTDVTMTSGEQNILHVCETSLKKLKLILSIYATFSNNVNTKFKVMKYILKVTNQPIL